MIDPISFLSWDTNFFKLKTGRVHLVDPSSLSGLLWNAFQEDYQLIYLSADTEIKEHSQGLFTLHDVGGRVDYLIDTLPTPILTSESSHAIQEYEGGVNDELLNLAYLSGSLSRFKLDQQLPENSFYQLYAAWINRELSNRADYSIYTYRHEETILGMITAKWLENECAISLLSVDSKYHGQGIGSSLIHYLLSVCTTKNCDLVRVSTQMSNVPARLLYEKCKFKVWNSSYLYHLHRCSSPNHQSIV